MCQNGEESPNAKEDHSVNQRSALWILAGCLAMAIGVAAVFAFGVPVNNVLLVALVLACPLSHLFMMRSGMHDHAQHHSPQRLGTADPSSKRPASAHRSPS